MRLSITIIVALSQHFIFIYAKDGYCFGKDTERTQTRHFTSKTAYQIIKAKDTGRQYLVPGCKPVKIWIFHRHGTRLPTKTTIKAAPRLDILREEIVKNYRKPANNSLCPEDFNALAMWKWNTSISIDQEEFLTTQGYEDLRGTAKTYQRYYSGVLTKHYSNTYYKFRHTDTQRTTESFKAFAEGLFGSNNDVKAEPIPELDLLLRPYDYCQSWRSHDYSGVESENYKFKHSLIWNETIADISKRLGFEYTLDVSDVQLMWDMCRYEQAWQVDRTSVWCAAFLPHQVDILEYEDDIKYFYKLGYGYEENFRINCRVVQDMLTHLNDKIGPNVVAYFAHSSGIQTLITALGIAKDKIPLTSINYNRRDRLWKTSHLDPFASNFLAVKYECNRTSPENEKVIFLLNQNVVDLDWCNVGLCSWSEVLERYRTLYTADCNSYFCAGSGAACSLRSIYVFSLALMFVIIYI
ncbi:multiple inositol polyphosphate phosphatase 1 isoform X2 [Eurosta solidaginis]